MGNNKGVRMRCESEKPHSLREDGPVLADKLSTSGRKLEFRAFDGIWNCTEYAMPNPSMVLHSLLSVGGGTCESWGTCATSAAYVAESDQFLGDHHRAGVACDGHSRRIYLSCPVVLDGEEFDAQVSPSALDPTCVLSADNIIVLTCRNALLIQLWHWKRLKASVLGRVCRENPYLLSAL
jgi:hypothetical protein